LNQLSIKYKQTLIIMLTNVVALLLACLAFGFYEVLSYRADLEKNLSVLTQLIGDNCASALSSNNQDEARQVLAALVDHPDIKAACIYNNGGKVVTVYTRFGEKESFIPPKVIGEGRVVGRDSLAYFHHIADGDEDLGTVYVQADLNELYKRLYRFLLTALAVFGVSGLVAFGLSSRLSRVISGPILAMAKTAKTVTQEKDYSVRMRRQGNDEIGVLIEAFNEMLRQIENRDAALQKSHAELEVRVKERTEALASSVSLIRATLESTADGILAVDCHGKVTSVNEKFQEMWAIPPGDAQDSTTANINEMMLSRIKTTESLPGEIDKAKADPHGDSFDVVELKDGRIYERYSKPQLLEENDGAGAANKIVGRVWSFRDITQRRRSEIEKEEMHAILVDASRQAGMAEVATNVLHNVGNVLNSVNVSCAMILSKIQKSKSANLGKVVDLLGQHTSDLAFYLTEDPKGKQVPGYLETLSGQLADEQKATLDEIRHLQQNIEHINAIVAMQQDYAHVSYVPELVKVSGLIEDSLRMNVAALQRHGIQVIREFEDVVPIKVVKHKVIQILVNLIRNAKYACDESSCKEKVLKARLVTEERKVKITIEDNGVGIPAENLTRIFQHGFTTRKEGHGFGLHSSALAATEMNGSLTVYSAGLGQGATFTLELPANDRSK
jgi:signal transduction histidine kinase/HAMP domain-containing protein